MSAADRDYLRAGAFHERGWTGSPVTWTLLLGNFALWMVFKGSGSGLYAGTLSRAFDALVLHPSAVFADGRPWQPLTTLFVHDLTEVGPVLCNMAYLFFFGREVERMLGHLAFTRLYLLAGLVGSGVAVGVAALGLVPASAFLGASGCVFGVLAAFACRRPHEPVFGSIPAWAFVGALVAAQLSWFGVARSDPLFFAHLGGGLVGFAEGFLAPRLASSRTKRTEARLRSAHVDEDRAASDARRRVDALLEKINASGIGSLSAEERLFLESASRRFR